MTTVGRWLRSGAGRLSLLLCLAFAAGFFIIGPVVDDGGPALLRLVGVRGDLPTPQVPTFAPAQDPVAPTASPASSPVAG